MIVAANLGALQLIGSYDFQEFRTVALGCEWEDTKQRFGSKRVGR